jgi:dipeptidyl aminopeptidase/acylaminoacyl peptidase
MITNVHGGPSAATIPDYISSGTIRGLVEHGYFVFMPNPRGSYGQGEAFTAANVKDLGGGDLQDILKGVDAVEATNPVDERRLGIFGHSYGGFMTMWTVTHTNRFHAAVAGAGIANWMSYYGQNGIDQWMLPFFGASPYDDPTVYDRLSPIRTIKAAKTPTFIYVGDRDVECPAAQSQEFWHGLKAVGDVTTLVVYPNEGHAIRAPEHRKDLADRILAWFDRYLAAPAA